MGKNPSKFKKGSKFPVGKVSWKDAQKFFRKLIKRSSVKFGLPSEAQWEYACRGGKAIPYGTGNGRVSSENANYGGNDSTTPVGKYPANTLGLHDMSGNVSEWVQDKATSYKKNDTDNPNFGKNRRVFRGGPGKVQILV